jgi:hypothetical protein
MIDNVADVAKMKSGKNLPGIRSGPPKTACPHGLPFFLYTSAGH